MIDVPVLSTANCDVSVHIDDADGEPQLSPSVLNIASAEAEYGRRRIEALAANIEAFIACTDQPVMMVARNGTVSNFNTAWCRAMGLAKSAEPDSCMQSLSEVVQDAVFEMLGNSDGSFNAARPVSIPFTGVQGHTEALILPVYHLPEVLEGVAVLLR